MQYIDIGHGDASAFLWVFMNGKIQYARASTGTHESIWGLDVEKYMRGRYCPRTHAISFVRPSKCKDKQLDAYWEVCQVFPDYEVIHVFDGMGNYSGAMKRDMVTP